MFCRYLVGQRLVNYERHQWNAILPHPCYQLISLLVLAIIFLSPPSSHYSVHSHLCTSTLGCFVCFVYTGRN